MKTISAFTRRADLSREAFRDYYETRHAGLGMTHFPFTKYIRNHVVQPGPTVDGIDCISEFYVDDWDRSAELTKAATGELFARDEQAFMDRSRIAAAVVEETLVQGPPREVDRKPVRRRILCIDLPPGEERQAAALELSAWASCLPVGGRRVTLDVAVGLAGDAFPYDTPFPYEALVSIWAPGDLPALVSIWAPGDLPALSPPRGGAVVRAELLVDVCESPPEEMAARLATQGREPGQS